MKKNEKSRNVKAVKNQLQQIEIYIEKLQVRKSSFNLLALILLTFSSKSFLVFLSSVEKTLRFLMKTFQEFSPYNGLQLGSK